ncbi:MAG: MFS transporter, partial [Adlercreutzia equolifaciens]
SLLGVLAWDFPSLVAARLIQAVATGLYFPVVNEALLNLSPKNGAGRLLAVNSGIIGIGLAVAPIVAGLVITYWGLRVLFAIPTVAAFVLFFIARRTIVDIMPRQKLPVDGLSVVLIAVGLSAFMIGLNEVTRNPLPMAALMIAGIAVCAWFIHRQGRLAHPLLDMRPLRNKTYALGETLIVLSYMSSIYLSLLIPLYLEGVAGFTPFIAGCLLAPATLCYAGLCFVSGRMLGKAGVWPLVPSDSACALSGSWRLRCSRGSILRWPSWAAWRLRARESAPSILRLRASIWKCSRPSCPRAARRSIPLWCRSQDLFRRRSSSVSCRGRFTA